MVNLNRRRLVIYSGFSSNANSRTKNDKSAERFHELLDQASRHMVQGDYNEAQICCEKSKEYASSLEDLNTISDMTSKIQIKMVKEADNDSIYEVLLKKGTTLLQAKKYDQAKLQFEKALNVKPSGDEAKRLLLEVKRKINERSKTKSSGK